MFFFYLFRVFLLRDRFIFILLNFRMYFVVAHFIIHGTPLFLSLLVCYLVFCAMNMRVTFAYIKSFCWNTRNLILCVLCVQVSRYMSRVAWVLHDCLMCERKFCLLNWTAVWYLFVLYHFVFCWLSFSTTLFFCCCWLVRVHDGTVIIIVVVLHFMLFFYFYYFVSFYG